MAVFAGTYWLDPNIVMCECDEVRKLVDFKDIQKRHLFCRIAAGDRRKPFPGCCQQLACTIHEDGKRIRVAKSDLPLLPIKDTFVYV